MGRTVDAVERLADVRLYVLIDGGESEAAFANLVQRTRWRRASTRFSCERSG